MNEALAAQRAGLDPLLFDAIPALRPDPDPTDIAPSLPRDHPAWQRDVVSISMRARAVLAAMRPFVLKVLTFWDHRLREITLGAAKVSIDSSGCYRIE